ncbi:hypothetical protein HYT01_01665 [Candidatus Giovannonibacteria bacterium]|nr:hypothetical protein [Candidatus Giovannonibacteria bacterium]
MFREQKPTNDNIVTLWTVLIIIGAVVAYLSFSGWFFDFSKESAKTILKNIFPSAKDVEVAPLKSTLSAEERVPAPSTPPAFPSAASSKPTSIPSPTSAPSGGLKSPPAGGSEQNKEALPPPPPPPPPPSL